MKRPTLFSRLLSLGCLLSMLPLTAQANYSERSDVDAFIEEMHQEHGFDKAQMRQWMSEVKQQTTALEAIARPAEGVLTWGDYRRIFLNDKRIEQGVQFWKENRELLNRAEQQYGVEPAFIVAIIGVETYYGRHAGNYPVLDALTTLGFDYPPRAAFFRKQLKHFLLMVREEKLNIKQLTGSYAGAMGMPQFIPSSFRSYAVDFDGNGVRDFWHGPADSIGSVANYFKRHGWKLGEAVTSQVEVNAKAAALGSRKMKPHTSVADFRQAGVSTPDAFADQSLATLLKLDADDGDEYWLALNNFYVITRYNHSPLYAMAVYQLSQAITEKYQAK
jgi:membrane-bound lytic murein transglycosylase B